MYNLDPAVYQYFLIKVASEGKTVKDVKNRLSKAIKYLKEYSDLENKLPEASKLGEIEPDIFMGVTKKLDKFKTLFTEMFNENVKEYLTSAKKYKEMPLQGYSDKRKDMFKKLFIAAIAVV
jgi:hypothetical protein